MRFDGPLLARAWLAVAQAAGSEKLHVLTYKAVAIEEYPGGIRLIATDRTILLTSWVPDLDHYYDTGEPERALLPDRTVVASDVDGRARSMLGHILALANRIHADDYTPGDIEVSIDFDVRVPAGTGGAQPSFEGMDPTYTVLSSPEVEKVYVPVIDGITSWIDWRRSLDAHVTKRTTDMTYVPELLERIGKIAKHAFGPVRFHFGGAGGTTSLEYVHADPPVHGVFISARTDDPSETECRTCAEGSVCLKHSSGLHVVEDEA